MHVLEVVKISLEVIKGFLTNLLTYLCAADVVKGEKANTEFDSKWRCSSAVKTCICADSAMQTRGIASQKHAS